jgi:hypothetical protein
MSYTSLGLPIISYGSGGSSLPTMPAAGPGISTPSGFSTPAPTTPAPPPIPGVPTLSPSAGLLTSPYQHTPYYNPGNYAQPPIAPPVSEPEAGIFSTVLDFVTSHPILTAGIGVGAWFLFFRRRTVS